MASIPQPRAPRCLIHHVWHASCADCCEQRKAERQAADQRLKQAAK